MAFFGSRILALVPLVALPIITAADVGSIALVHLSVPDDTAEAGRAAVAAIQFKDEATPKQAEFAFQSAASVADVHGQEIDRETFSIYKDGSVTLTVSETAPTLMVKHIPFLRGLAHSSTTTTVKRATW